MWEVCDVTGTGAGTMDSDALTATLLRQTRGAGGRFAAVGLPAEHDYWLRQIAHHHPEFLRTDACTGAVVDLDWPALYRPEGGLDASSAQRGILAIALSPATDTAPVDLGRVLSGLGAVDTVAVLRAVAAAAGHPEVAPATGPDDAPGDAGGPAPVNGAHP